MSEFTAEETHSKDNTGRERRAPAIPTTKVLSMTECPSCHRKGTMEVFHQKHGKYTYCYSCGHRERSFDC